MASDRLGRPETDLNLQMIDDNELTIVNLVASGKRGVGEIDTKQLAKDWQTSNSTYQPGRVYIRRPNCPTITIYRSGKFTIAGAESYLEVEKTIQGLTESIDDLGINISESEVVGSISVEFIVLQGDLGDRVDLEDAMKHLEGQIEYEPEQFPAIIYQPNNTDCTITIFSTGKISITGIQQPDCAVEIYNQLKQTLFQ